MTTRIRLSDKYETCREGFNINVVGWFLRAVRRLWTGAHPGMSKPGAASSKPSNRNPGETVQLTSDQSPVLRAACQ